MKLKKITGKDIKDAVDWLWEHKDEGGCIHHVLGTTGDGTKLCFVVGWANGRDYGDDDKKYGYFDEGYCISAKIGYQHSNNAMQTDYDWDFNMPYDLETGDVWDTSSYVPRDADWEREAADYNKEAQKIWDTYGKPGKGGTTALDLMESKKSESAKGSMRRKQESLKKWNERMDTLEEFANALYDEVMKHTNDDIVIENAALAQEMGERCIDAFYASKQYIATTADEFADEVGTILSGSPLDGSPFTADDALEYAREIWGMPE